MFRFKTMSVAFLIVCFCVLSVMTATVSAGIFGSRQVSRQRIVQPRQQVFVQRQQFVLQRQAIIVPRQQLFVSPFIAPQAVIVPQQQIVVPHAFLQPSQAIIYGNSGALILR